MNTCVLCFSRRNAFECTILSRSRWNGGRMGAAVGEPPHLAEPRHVEEGDRVRVAAMLAADAELQVRLGLTARPRRQPDEPPDARLVDRLERRAVDDLALHVLRQEAALDVV